MGGSAERAGGGLILVALAVLVVATLAVGQTLACSDPADNYAIEVVLNAPGVEYNLSALAGARVIEYAGGTAYMYRSRYDSRLLVIVSEQQLPGEGRRLAVRVQVPVAVRDRTVFRCALPVGCSWQLRERVPITFTAGRGEARLELGTLRCDTACFVKFKPIISASARGNLTVSGFLVLKGVKGARTPSEGEVEYRVSMPCLLSVGEPCFRILALIPGYDVPMRLEGGEYRVELVLSWSASVDAQGVLERVEVESSCLKLAPQPEPVRELGWRERGGKLEKEVGNAIASVDTATGVIEVAVKDGEQPSEKALEELRLLLEKLGYTGDLNLCKFENFTESAIEPYAPIGEGEVKAALKAELEWMIERGVVSGLKREDVERIVGSAELGFAGWNNRLVWHNGNWVPYSSVPGASLVECYGGVHPAFLARGGEGVSQAQAAPGSAQSGGQPQGAVSGERSAGATGWLQAFAAAVLAALAAAILSYAIVKRSLPV